MSAPSGVHIMKYLVNGASSGSVGDLLLPCWACKPSISKGTFSAFFLLAHELGFWPEFLAWSWLRARNSGKGASLRFNVGQKA